MWNTLCLLVLVTQAAALASGLMDKLDQPGHYTLFAPTDEAFDKLSPGYMERIMGDKDVTAGTLYMWYTNDDINYLHTVLWLILVCRGLEHLNISAVAML